VRPVRIGSDPRGARLERIELAPSAPQPVFAVAGMGGSMPPPHAPNPSDQTFPRFVPETGALQPSTLQAQAAQLEAGNEPPAPRPLAALAPEKPRAVVARSRGPFEIQIGAFGDSAEAERRMAAARERAGGLLDPYRGVAMPVQSGSSKLYRARFRGFDATAANDTCSRLRSLKIDCFVIKAE
jgi:D-alanyl-D-alanine carboxypeptidase